MSRLAARRHSGAVPKVARMRTVTTVARVFVHLLPMFAQCLLCDICASPVGERSGASTPGGSGLAKPVSPGVATSVSGGGGCVKPVSPGGRDSAAAEGTRGQEDTSERRGAFAMAAQVAQGLPILPASGASETARLVHVMLFAVLLWRGSLQIQPSMWRQALLTSAVYATVLAISRLLPGHTTGCRWLTTVAAMLPTSLLLCPCVGTLYISNEQITHLKHNNHSLKINNRLAKIPKDAQKDPKARQRHPKDSRGNQKM